MRHVCTDVRLKANNRHMEESTNVLTPLILTDTGIIGGFQSLVTTVRGEAAVGLPLAVGATQPVARVVTQAQTLHLISQSMGATLCHSLTPTLSATRSGYAA